MIPPPVAVWLDYLIDLEITKLTTASRRATSSAQQGPARAARGRVFRWIYDRLRGPSATCHGLPDQDELKRLAAPYYKLPHGRRRRPHARRQGLYAHLGKQAHMTCELSPYSCMPNTMSIGAMSNVLGRHPDLLYAPIEVKGTPRSTPFRAPDGSHRGEEARARSSTTSLADPGSIEYGAPGGGGARRARATYRVPHWRRGHRRERALPSGTEAPSGRGY